MCGVMYFKGDGDKYNQVVVRLLEESRVRGLHAFGVSIRPSPEDNFQTVRTFNLDAAVQYIKENKFCELIGHCRYDTSGDWQIINNNQPIVIGESILAFNGVVRMSTRDEYQQEFQREYATENDGEIVLRMLVEEDTRLMSLLDQKRVTFAGVAYVNGRMLAIRNERRPLWRAITSDAQFVFSTYDIWSRAVQKIYFSEEPNRLGQGKAVVTDVPTMEAIWL